MSVTTTADENLRDAKDEIDSAYKNLLNFVDEDTWGSHEYPKSFKLEVMEVAHELYKLKQKLE